MKQTNNFRFIDKINIVKGALIMKNTMFNTSIFCNVIVFLCHFLMYDLYRQSGYIGFDMPDYILCFIKRNCPETLFLFSPTIKKKN